MKTTEERYLADLAYLHVNIEIDFDGLDGLIELTKLKNKALLLLTDPSIGIYGSIKVSGIEEWVVKARSAGSRSSKQ